ncbi:MAG: hypothetical protein Q7U38_02075 [Methylobacter sp.]|nr:hypothetical protein [Methylobacter sp.]MDP2097391.1 hypothetical protein [Methylobacter sp.]MDP2428587.1 hypothetical protein [Methylobacter sp.]MDP3056423.1 hypothetical protein [Methylobacter sp.]MDP3363169.1 hypothetical protein [Methylobacter sp.]
MNEEVTVDDTAITQGGQILKKRYKGSGFNQQDKKMKNKMLCQGIYFAGKLMAQKFFNIRK